jgi:hypothetical protein
MSDEIRIAFVDGHADVWRLFDDPAQLRNIAESCGAQLVGIATSSRSSRRRPLAASRSCTRW